MTEYYDNIRNKLANLDEKSGKCGELDGTLPLRLCKTPMKVGGSNDNDGAQKCYANRLLLPIGSYAVHPTS